MGVLTRPRRAGNGREARMASRSAVASARPSRGIMVLSAILNVALPALAAVAQQPPLPPAVRAAADRITRDALMRDVEYLASDALGGRATFSAGLDSAANYIERRL